MKTWTNIFLVVAKLYLLYFQTYYIVKQYIVFCKPHVLP